jgi:hypothetical protein
LIELIEIQAVRIIRREHVRLRRRALLGIVPIQRKRVLRTAHVDRSADTARIEIDD